MEHCSELIPRYCHPLERLNLMIDEVILLKVTEYTPIIAPHHIAAAPPLTIAKPTLGRGHMPNLLYLLSETIQLVYLRQPLIVPLAPKNEYLSGDIRNPEFDVPGGTNKLPFKLVVWMTIYFEANLILVLTVASVEDERVLDVVAAGVAEAVGGVVLGVSGELVQLFQADVQLFVVLFVLQIRVLGLVVVLAGFRVGVLGFVAQVVRGNVCCFVQTHGLLLQLNAQIKHISDIFRDSFLKLIEKVIPQQQIASRRIDRRHLLLLQQTLIEYFLFVEVKQIPILIEIFDTVFEAVLPGQLHQFIIAAQQRIKLLLLPRNPGQLGIIDTPEGTQRLCFLLFQIGLDFTKHLAYFGLMVIDRRQDIGFFQLHPLHLVVQLHFPIELDNLFGLLLEIPNGLLQCLELVIFGVADDTLEAHILETLQAERLQLFVMFEASLLIQIEGAGFVALLRLVVVAAVGLLVVVLDSQDRQVLRQVGLLKRHVELLAFRADYEVGVYQGVHAHRAQGVPAVRQQARDVGRRVELFVAVQAVHNVVIY